MKAVLASPSGPAQRAVIHGTACVHGCPIDTVPPMGQVENGNGGQLTGPGSARNAGAAPAGFATAAGGHHSSEYALKSRRRKLPCSVLVLSANPPPAPAGVDCPWADPPHSSNQNRRAKKSVLKNLNGFCNPRMTRNSAVKAYPPPHKEAVRVSTQNFSCPHLVFCRST